MKMDQEELGLAFCNLSYRETSLPISPQKDSGFETSYEEYENVGDGHYENTQGECVKNVLYQNVVADNKAHYLTESPTVSYENVGTGADNGGEEQEPYENVCVRDDHEVCYENLDVETWEREYRPGDARHKVAAKHREIRLNKKPPTYYHNNIPPQPHGVERSGEWKTCNK